MPFQGKEGKRDQGHLFVEEEYEEKGKSFLLMK